MTLPTVTVPDQPVRVSVQAAYEQYLRGHLTRVQYEDIVSQARTVAAVLSPDEEVRAR